MARHDEDVEPDLAASDTRSVFKYFGQNILHRKHITNTARASQIPLPRRWKILAACALTITLPGCGFLQHHTAGVITPIRGAAIVNTPDVSQNAALEVTNYYASSFSACMEFKEGVLSAATGVNASADYATLILTALATLMAPLNTVHMLTAAATATTGLKSTFANDVTASNSVNLTIAFDKIYFQPMAALAETTLSGPITTDRAPGIVSQILSLQEQCSLDEARAYINQNLSQGVAVKPTGQALRLGRVVFSR